MRPLDDSDHDGQAHADPDDRTLTDPLGVPAMPMADLVNGVPDTKEAETAWRAR